MSGGNSRRQWLGLWSARPSPGPSTTSLGGTCHKADVALRLSQRFAGRVGGTMTLPLTSLVLAFAEPYETAGGETRMGRAKLGHASHARDGTQKGDLSILIGRRIKT